MKTTWPDESVVPCATSPVYGSESTARTSAPPSTSPEAVEAYMSTLSPGHDADAVMLNAFSPPPDDEETDGPVAETVSVYVGELLMLWIDSPVVESSGLTGGLSSHCTYHVCTPRETVWLNDALVLLMNQAE